MRVASRRLRSALRDFEPYLRKGKLRRASDSIKFLARALGAVRDQDVAIQALEKLQEDAPEEVIAGLKLITDERRRERERARLLLMEMISQEELATLQMSFEEAIEQATTPRTKERDSVEASSGEPSFRQVGREIISARFQELLKLSTSLYHPFDVEPLHDMRIAAKRLRYALELFTGCWGEKLTDFAQEISEMQGDLGDLHDCDEWIASLGVRLHAKRGRAKLTAFSGQEVRRAAVWLINHFLKVRDKHFRAALTRWEKWEEQKLADNLQAALEEPTQIVQEQEQISLSQPEAEPVAHDLQNA
jgi:CHAD domain-containing protein